MIGIAPSKDSKPVNEANVDVIEGKSEEKSDILGDAAEKNESRTGITREHILQAYANSVKSTAMELVEDNKDKAKELYERALQEVGILESELDHTNSEMVRKELENQLQYLKR
jgi:predicted transcriptional regulator